MIQGQGLFVVLTLSLALWLVVSIVPDIRIEDVAFGEVENGFEAGSVLFVGDVLLGRHVETLMNENGKSYPFKHVVSLIESVDVSIANFEGSVPKEHIQTPDHNLTFSVREAALGTLKDEGFDVLSLANNHSFDHHEAGYIHTLGACEKYELICRGHPYELDLISTTSVRAGDTLVGLVFLYEPSIEKDDAQLQVVLSGLKKRTEIQVAFVHWGDEYEKLHSESQEELGHMLIDSGVDAVVGHHPHVVQDIEMYDGKPIFYSLGNFIFDQYFDEAVQVGLGVRMSIEKDAVTFTLVPFTSLDSPSQPRIMTIDERTRFLSKLTVHRTGEDNEERHIVVIAR